MIFAEEDTIIGAIKSEEFIYIVSPHLKIGRMEWLVKDSVNGRYDLNKELKYFREQTKEIKTWNISKKNNFLKNLLKVLILKL